MTLASCFAKAASMGVITRDEAKELTDRFNTIAKEAGTVEAARTQMAEELKAEAEHRRRVAILSETARQRIMDTLTGYRNLKGQADKAEAFVMLHENMGRLGSFIEDAEGKRDIIVRKAQAELGLLLKEFKRGALTGDRRRQGNWVGNGVVQARMDNFVRELFGEKTDDATAKAMAAAWVKVSDQLKDRFNAAGGAIGTLEKWGLPQSHNREALLNAGRGAWVEHMMKEGVLDRDRTVHPLTRKPMSDAELRKALEVSWDRITTDGNIDLEVSPQGTGGGRPALYKQHADHRFLHFKDANAWIAYQKEFGAPDVFGTIMGHVNVMARDIAHMETFGPNPNMVREFIKATLNQEAANLKTRNIVWRENLDAIKEVFSKIPAPTSEHTAILNRIIQTMEAITGIHDRLQQLRDSYRPKDGPSAEIKAQMDKLQADLIAKNEELTQLNVQKDTTYYDLQHDPAVFAPDTEYKRLLQDAQEPAPFVDGLKPDDAGDYLRGRIARADAMWELMRGASPQNMKWANRMATTRNLITASSLGAAWFSSLADVSFGQDMRLRMGMGLGQSGAWRGMALTLKEMITMGKREDAVAAGLGLDTALHVMHQQARMTGTVDMRGWSGFMADRVLTMGMLQPWTQAGKHMAGLDIMRWMGKLSQHEFKDLPKGTQKALETHGLDAGTWDKVRSTPLHEGHLRANEIEASAGRDLAERYTLMLLRETRYAVPEGTVEARSVTTGYKAGSLMGELVRSGGQFKGYAIGIVFLQMRRVAQELMAGDKSAAGYAGALLLTSTLLGGMAMALKDMKDGRDPRRWLDEKTFLEPKMWGAAFLQAGGLGIYGDLLFSTQNRVGGTMADTMKGPLWDRVENVWDMTGGAVHKKLKGEKANMGREATRFVRMNTPGANLWPIGLPVQRLFDQVQILVDADARKAFRTDMTKRKSEFGQDYWWPKGKTAPDRAPNVGRIFATR